MTSTIIIFILGYAMGVATLPLWLSFTEWPPEDEYTEGDYYD